MTGAELTYFGVGFYDYSGFLKSMEFLDCIIICNQVWNVEFIISLIWLSASIAAANSE
jgi:hypothetical protein